MTIKEPRIKQNNSFQRVRSIIDKKLIDFISNSNQFNEVPPIIGVIVADQYGNTILVLEYNSEDKCKYRPIKSYLTEDTKNMLEVDLISMYFSSFKVFATQTNIQNLSHLEINGSNIKIQLHFLFDKYMIILFLNSNTNLKSIDKNHVITYFERILRKYHQEFKNFNTTQSKRILEGLEKKGKIWLEKINKAYLNNYEKLYLKKHQIIEDFVSKITPLIQKDLIEYLECIPEEILDDLLKEITNKIQDQLFELNVN